MSFKSSKAVLGSNLRFLVLNMISKVGSIVLRFSVQLLIFLNVAKARYIPGPDLGYLRRVAENLPAYAPQQAASERSSATSQFQSIATCRGEAARKLAATSPGLRALLQHFTPEPLCASSYEAETASANAAETAQLALLQRKRSSTDEIDLQTYPGCTTSDLHWLMANPSVSQSTCQWNMQCQYDPQRFPQILYQAVLSQTDSKLKNVVCAVICLPVRRTLYVVRPIHTAGGDPSVFTQQTSGAYGSDCPKWELKLETVTVAFDCTEA